MVLGAISHERLSLVYLILLADYEVLVCLLLV